MIQKYIDNFRKNIATIKVSDIKRRIVPVLIYLNWGNILVIIQILILMGYTTWMIHTHKEYKEEDDKKEIEFKHEVLWGKNGTDGTMQKILNTFFAFLLIFGAKKIAMYIIKKNTDLFTKELRPNYKRNKMIKKMKKVIPKIKETNGFFESKLKDVSSSVKDFFTNSSDVIENSNKSLIETPVIEVPKKKDLSLINKIKKPVIEVPKKKSFSLINTSSVDEFKEYEKTFF